MAATQSASTDLVEVAQRIRVIRGKRVLLDSDLAGLYGVKTLRLNEQVRRNMARFPEDFLLHLSNQELAALRSQIAILKPGRGQHRKYPPLAFTEHGAVMAATILNSARAVAMSVYVVRAFVELRTALMANAQLARKLDALEKTVAVLDADSRRQFRELRALVFSLAMPPEREH
jgi:phage regulator Rha-like protein